jgi:hypothetical protein
MLGTVQLDAGAILFGMAVCGQFQSFLKPVDSHIEPAALGMGGRQGVQESG